MSTHMQNSQQVRYIFFRNYTGARSRNRIGGLQDRQPVGCLAYTLNRDGGFMKFGLSSFNTGDAMTRSPPLDEVLQDMGLDADDVDNMALLKLFKRSKPRSMFDRTMGRSIAHGRLVTDPRTFEFRDSAMPLNEILKDLFEDLMHDPTVPHTIRRVIPSQTVFSMHPNPCDGVQLPPGSYSSVPANY